MRAWLLVAVSCLLCVAAEEELLKAHKEDLVLLELRESVSSPSGGEDVRVLKLLLQEHEPLYNITKWTILLDKPYSIEDDDPLQTQLEFEAHMTSISGIKIFATTSNLDIIGETVIDVEIQNMKSRVARVGNQYDRFMSSMRVASGELDEVRVRDKVCKKEDSPCYYLRTQLPMEVPRCLNIKQYNRGGILKYCDDVITSFHEIPEVGLSLKGRELTVMANFTSEAVKKVEVVAFDLKDPTVMVSPEGFECRVKVEPLRQKAHVCLQELQESDGDLSELGILVVGLDIDGYVVQSKMQTYLKIVEKTDNKGLIIGCVIGVLAAIALIAGIFVFLKGRQEKEKAASSQTRSAKYERTATTEQKAQEEA